MSVRIVANFVIFSNRFNVQCSILLQLDHILRHRHLSMGLRILIYMNIYFVCLDSDHYGGTTWAFRTIGAFGLRQGLQHLKEACNFFVFGNSLLVEPVETVVDCDDLVEDRSLRRQERIGYFQATRKPVLGIKYIVRIALLLLLYKPSFSRIAVKAYCQVGDLLNDLMIGDFWLCEFKLVFLKGHQLYLVQDLILVNPKVIGPVFRAIELLNINLWRNTSKFPRQLQLLVQDVQSLFLQKGQFKILCRVYQVIQNSNIIQEVFSFFQAYLYSLLLLVPFQQQQFIERTVQPCQDVVYQVVAHLGRILGMFEGQVVPAQLIIVLSKLGVKDADLKFKFAQDSVVLDSDRVFGPGRDYFLTQLLQSEIFTYLLGHCDCKLSASLLQEAYLIVENSKIDDNQHSQMWILNSLHIVFKCSQQINTLQSLSSPKQSLDFLQNLHSLVV